MTKTIFSKSKKGRNKYRAGDTGIPDTKLNGLVPEDLLRTKSIGIPDLSESEVVRHFTSLARKNYGVDDGIYPLGSCTMKYNPKINEVTARLPGFAHIHPLQPIETVQGALGLMYETQEWLKEISGFDAVSLQPAAGAHGELTGVLIMRAYHLARKDEKRVKMLIPDSAHGTNPASVSMAGIR